MSLNCSDALFTISYEGPTSQTNSKNNYIQSASGLCIHFGEELNKRPRIWVQFIKAKSSDERHLQFQLLLDKVHYATDILRLPEKILCKMHFYIQLSLISEDNKFTSILYKHLPLNIPYIYPGASYHIKISSSNVENFSVELSPTTSHKQFQLAQHQKLSNEESECYSLFRDLNYYDFFCGEKFGCKNQLEIWLEEFSSENNLPLPENITYYKALAQKIFISKIQNNMIKKIGSRICVSVDVSVDNDLKIEYRDINEHYHLFIETFLKMILISYAADQADFLNEQIREFSLRSSLTK